MRKNFKNISKAYHGDEVISRQWGWDDKHVSSKQKNGYTESDKSLSNLSPTRKRLRKSIYVVLLSLSHLPRLQHIVRLVYCCSYERKIQLCAPSAKSLLQILGNINIHTHTKQTQSRIPIKLTSSSGIWEYVSQLLSSAKFKSKQSPHLPKTLPSFTLLCVILDLNICGLNTNILILWPIL